MIKNKIVQLEFRVRGELQFVRSLSSNDYFVNNKYRKIDKKYKLVMSKKEREWRVQWKVKREMRENNTFEVFLLEMYGF